MADMRALAVLTGDQIHQFDFRPFGWMPIGVHKLQETAMEGLLPVLVRARSAARHLDPAISSEWE